MQLGEGERLDEVVVVATSAARPSFASELRITRAIWGSSSTTSTRIEDILAGAG
jgi:hypothetical protein